MKSYQGLRYGWQMVGCSKIWTVQAKRHSSLVLRYYQSYYSACDTCNASSGSSRSPNLKLFQDYVLLRLLFAIQATGGMTFQSASCVWMTASS